MYRWWWQHVNANFPPNRIPHGSIGRREEEVYDKKCTLYLVGILDNEKENLDLYLDYLIPRLKAKYEYNPNSKFLFHCFVGKSRSVVLAIAFLVEILGMKFEEALELVKEKRPIISYRIS